ncbi:MAG TPA: hypothetical protein VN873_08925 [Candidatus Angelobacter sp.]|nr:hypothetical protein [Candidatus Angelobacter sp.]
MIISPNQVISNFLPTGNTARKKSISEGSVAVGADQAEITSAMSETDLTAAGAPIPDEGSAMASVERARSLIISQNALAMLTQASGLRPEALQLLQQ